MPFDDFRCSPPHLKFWVELNDIGQMINSEDGESDLKSSMQARRLFSHWHHSAGPMCTPSSSAPLVRARQCPCSFPFIGCIADAAGQGDPSNAEDAIASYKDPSTPVYPPCSFAPPPRKGKFGLSVNSPLSSFFSFYLLTFSVSNWNVMLVLHFYLYCFWGMKSL